VDTRATLEGLFGAIGGNPDPVAGAAEDCAFLTGGGLGMELGLLVVRLCGLDVFDGGSLSSEKSTESSQLRDVMLVS
jgi:hypothetical protein